MRLNCQKEKASEVVGGGKKMMMAAPSVDPEQMTAAKETEPLRQDNIVVIGSSDIPLVIPIALPCCLIAQTHTNFCGS
jgi:hypothetical protein